MPANRAIRPSTPALVGHRKLAVHARWESPTRKAASEHDALRRKHLAAPLQSLATMPIRVAGQRPATRTVPAMPATTALRWSSAMAATQCGKERICSTSAAISTSSEASWPRNQRQSLSSSLSSNRRNISRCAVGLCRHRCSSQRSSNWSSSRMPRRHRQRSLRSSASSTSTTSVSICLYARRASISCLMSAIAFAGFNPFGQVRVQFMMVWQRYSLNGSSSSSRRAPVSSSRLSTIQR
jgi:hypothetical protein